MGASLRMIVADYISQNDGTQQDQFRIHNIARRAVRELNLDITGYIRTQVLRLNANKTCDLPTDYIHFTKIGVVNERGEISTFKENRDLALASDQTGGRFQLPRVDDQPFTDTLPFNYINYFAQGSYFKLLGIGSGSVNIGEYRLDEKNRLIVFGSMMMYGEIVLEYFSDGSDDSDSDALIDERAYECVLAFIRWQDYLGKNKKHGLGEVQQARHDYFTAKETLRLRMNPMVKSVINEMIRSTIKGAPKA